MSMPIAVPYQWQHVVFRRPRQDLQQQEASTVDGAPVSHGTLSAFDSDSRVAPGIIGTISSSATTRRRNGGQRPPGGLHCQAGLLPNGAAVGSAPAPGFALSAPSFIRPAPGSGDLVAAHVICCQMDATSLCIETLILQAPRSFRTLHGARSSHPSNSLSGTYGSLGAGLSLTLRTRTISPLLILIILRVYHRHWSTRTALPFAHVLVQRLSFSATT